MQMKPYREWMLAISNIFPFAQRFIVIITWKVESSLPVSALVIYWFSA